MTRSEREQLIERYLNGGMSGAQEENFFIEVASNRELRQELKAYRLVEQGMAEESAAISSTSTYTALRTQVQGILVGTGAAATAGAEHAGSTSGSVAGSATGSGGGVGSTIAGMTLPVKWIVGSLAVAALGIGTFVLDPFGETKGIETGAIPAIERVEKGESRGETALPEGRTNELLPIEGTKNDEEEREGVLSFEERDRMRALESRTESVTSEASKASAQVNGGGESAEEKKSEQTEAESDSKSPSGNWLYINPPREKK